LRWRPAHAGRARLFPDEKVIACVRELPWATDSIERLIQRNVFSPSSIFNYDAGGTVYGRANDVAGQNGMVGAPYDALKQAGYGAQKDRLLLVQYENTDHPPGQDHARHPYVFGEPAFEHGFDHIDYIVSEFDDRAGTALRHRRCYDQGPATRNLASARPIQPIRQRRAFWRDPQNIPAGLQVV
jgi:sulfotransferase